MMNDVSIAEDRAQMIETTTKSKIDAILLVYFPQSVNNNFMHTTYLSRLTMLREHFSKK